MTQSRATTRNLSLALVLFAALLAAAAAACSSRRAPSVDEHLGVEASELFANGLPCASATQCTSGNCVDGVCRNTACGGGARDLQACSNVYGAVAGLTNGTCHTLVAGDACGSLTTVNPCSWRGTVVNGGNNCPNPPGGSSACFPCATSADCSGGFPVCIGGACVACNGDNGSAATAPCDAAAPVCTNGQCAQCSATNVSACAGATPTCDVSTGTCATCNGDKGSGATRACQTGAAPACLATGVCAACSATNATACNGNTPTCDTATNTCAACNGDNLGGTTQPCPTAANPYCNLAGGSAGSCGKCQNDLDCGLGHTGPTCNSAGACAAICTTDAMCAPNGWCPDTLLICVAKTANAQPLPAIAPVNGVCNPANGLRACVSGVCDPADNLCGLPNGATCGPPATAADCRSGICFAGDNKCGAPAGQPCVTQNDCRSLICPPSGMCGDCQTDATCGAAASGKVCDDLKQTCENGCRGTGGNGCAPGFVCTSTDATIGKCVQCVTDATCGSVTSGQVCNDANTCVVGCRGAGGNGCPATTTCSSVDGTVGTCQQCTTDASCGSLNSGQICSDTKQCVAGCRGTGGNGCPADEVCSSTTSMAGTCGPAMGTDGGVDAGPDASVDAGPTGGPDASTSGGLDASTGCTNPPCTTAAPDDGILEGGGFGCAVRRAGTGNAASTGAGTGTNMNDEGLGAFLFVALAGVIARRRARRLAGDAACAGEGA